LVIVAGVFHEYNDGVLLVYSSTKNFQGEFIFNELEEVIDGRSRKKTGNPPPAGRNAERKKG
jgi:hypothetical protein